MMTSPRQVPSLSDDPKRTRILEGAMTVFLAYGFQRTTMDDIARAAEISRPALYLLFRNKTDIYRALARDFLQDSLARSEEVLIGSGSFEERLEGAICCVFDLMHDIEQSPHGAEILDMKNSLAGDIVADGRARMGEMITAAVAGAAGGADLAARGYSAEALADMLLDAIDGLKMRGVPHDVLRSSARQFIRVISTALRA